MSDYTIGADSAGKVAATTSADLQFNYWRDGLTNCTVSGNTANSGADLEAWLPARP